MPSDFFFCLANGNIVPVIVHLTANQLFRLRRRIQDGIDDLLPGDVAVIFNERIATQIE